MPLLSGFLQKLSPTNRVDLSRVLLQKSLIDEEALQSLIDSLTLADAVHDPGSFRFAIAEAFAVAIGAPVVFSEYGRSWQKDSHFRKEYMHLMDAGNWHSYDRKWMLRELLQGTRDIPGSIAECGVYKGASAYFLCKFAREVDCSVHLFDSFSGLSTPSDSDGDAWNAGDMAVDLATVTRNLSEFPDVLLHPGWIPSTFDALPPDEVFRFVHVDVDLYEPTRESLEFFYPRVVDGGVILFDDYGFDSCPGARRAIDEFFESRSDTLLSLTTGQGLVIRGW